MAHPYTHATPPLCCHSKSVRSRSKHLGVDRGSKHLWIRPRWYGRGGPIETASVSSVLPANFTHSRRNHTSVIMVILQKLTLPSRLARSAHRQMSGVPAGNSTHCQQHNSTSWTTLGSVNRLRRSTTTYEVWRTRILLRRSSRVEFSSSTRPRRDGLLSF